MEKQQQHWQSRLTDESCLEKNYKGDWLIPIECSYCSKKYRMPAKEHGKSGVCVKCNRTIFIPFIPESLQVKCSSCGRRCLSSQDFCECGAMLAF